MELTLGKLLVQRGDHPELVQITSIGPDGILTIEYESDGSIHDYWSAQEIEELFEELIIPMLIYCKTGKSRFCLDHKSGFYWVSKYKSIWLDSSWNGLTLEQVKRACKLKAFW